MQLQKMYFNEFCFNIYFNIENSETVSSIILVNFEMHRWGIVKLWNRTWAAPGSRYRQISKCQKVCLPSHGSSGKTWDSLRSAQTLLKCVLNIDLVFVVISLHPLHQRPMGPLPVIPQTDCILSITWNVPRENIKLVMQAHYLNIMQFFLMGSCHKWGFKAMEHWGEFVWPRKS